MAAAELPVQDTPIPPNTSTAVAASGAPEETGSAGLIAGEGAPPARGPAMGPVAQLEAGREYTTEELDVLEKSSTPPPPQEFTSEQLDMEAVRLFDDPNYAPTRDEYFDLKATKDRLKAEGKLPGGFEIATQAVGGLVVTALDAFNTAVYSPLESIAKSSATLQTGIGRAALEAMRYSGYAKELIQGAPKYRDEDTGEFFFYNNEVQLQNALDSGRKLRPTTEEDLKDHEFEGYIAKKGIDAEYQDLATKTAPTELLTRVLTGRNQQEAPNLSQAGVIEMVADPTNLIPFGAGAKTIGLSRFGKVVSSEAAGAIEFAAGGLVKGNDALAERFANVVTNATGFTPRDISAAGKVINFGKNVGIGGGIAAGAAAVGAPPEVAATIAGFYPVYKAGFGVLRKIETGAGTAKIILRESADATNGLDQAARAAVLANPSVPQAFKEVLERPSQFVSIESTPARLAANQALSPQMRALASKLSTPAIVQAVRGSSALATGAVKGAAVNAPFALLAANAGDDEEAAAILGAGAAFGAAGAGVERFSGLQQRRQQAAISDVSRMLVDVELNGGDVGKMMSTQTPDSLVKLAAMQGTFRNALDFVPLNAIDYEKNVSSNGGSGAAGLFLQAAPGQRAKIYINLDAKRTGVEPHEFGHALLSSGALDGQQKFAARAWVDKTYGLDGIKARAAEYASSIIRGKNSEAFPDGNFEITPTTLSSEMENLSQGGLARGDMDGLDWARDEIFAETFAQASQSMDFAAIRRGAPAGENFLTFAEGILGAQARALTASGIRIDGQTGRPLDTPGSLFKENPLLATDKALLGQLGTYINNYRQWANNPTHEKPAGIKIAPSGRASDLANNPQVTFYDRGDGVMANAYATIDPVTGQAILRDQRDLNAEYAKLKAQVKALGGSKLLEPSNPVLGPKKTADGRVTIRGKVLPQSFDFLNGFMPHIRNFARQFEQFGQTGESMQVRYHSIGSGDTGAFRVIKLGDIDAITREVLPFEWQLTKAGNLNAVLLDLTQFRNRAMRGINDRNEALAPFNWELSQVETDLKQWMDNHRNNLPGENKIGTAKRDAINSLVGLATNYNRGKNPLNGAFGPGSAIKQFRLDRVDAAIGTGRQGFHFDYEKANGNLLPNIPAAMPDLSRDLPGQAMPSAPKPLKPIEEMTDRQLASFLKKHGEQPSSAIDVARRWSDGDRMWGAHEMGDELSLSPITDMNDLSGYSRDRLISLPKATENALYTPQGQAMPDAVPEFDPQAGAFIVDKGDETSMPVYQQANRGKPAVDNKGEPKFVQTSYDLITAPRIAEYSGPGPEDITKPDFKKFAYDITQKGQQQINAAIDSGAVDNAANSVVRFTQEVMNTPEIAAGMGWYSRMRENLLRVVGEDGREILSQLLGATSAKTPVDENFLQAMDAYEGIKAGRYDANRKAYLEMLAAEEKNKLKDIIVRRNYVGKVRTMADQFSKQSRQLKGKKKAVYLAEAQKLRDLAKKPPTEWTRQDRIAITMRATDMLPMRSNGKKFNANSMAVLKVISGKWLDNRDSPKTPNFAGNLSGRTVQATIDVWAARFLRETLYEGTGKPWRIQPKSETAVNNQDFALGQVIMARAGKKLGMNPDDLQAVLWFAEKHRWDNRGWTKNQGAEKSSFDTVFNVFFPKDGKPLTFAEASKIFKKSKK